MSEDNILISSLCQRVLIVLMISHLLSYMLGLFLLCCFLFSPPYFSISGFSISPKSRRRPFAAFITASTITVISGERIILGPSISETRDTHMANATLKEHQQRQSGRVKRRLLFIALRRGSLSDDSQSLGNNRANSIGLTERLGA